MIMSEENVSECRKIAEASVRQFFPRDCEKIIAEMKWDSINECFYFHYMGMYVGVEKDGYIHT